MNLLILPSCLLFLGVPLVSATHCPQWLSPIIGDWLAKYPEDPGVQLHLSSPHCDLHCTTSFQSNASNYTAEPPLLPDSPWRIASVTKPFTAAAILQVAHQDRLDLNASVEEYLPSRATALLEQEQGAENASQITPWMLLHHTSGLGDHSSDPRFRELVLSNPEHKWTTQEILQWCAENLTPLSVPGAEFHYSETGYAYLGLALENTTSLNVGDAVRILDRLDALDMKSTWWEELEPTPPRALPRAGQYYGSIDVTHLDASCCIDGGAGLVSDAKDLSKFARAIHTGHLLDEDSMKLLYTTVPAPGFGEYGCGWINTTVAGEQTWWHGGSWGGWMYFVRSLDLVVTGTINQQDHSHIPLVQEIVGAIINAQGCKPRG